MPPRRPAPPVTGVRITDSANGTAGPGVIDSDTATVTVNPALGISGDSSVVEGTTYTLNLNGLDTASGDIDHWTITWGDNSPDQTVAGNPSSVTHTYLDGANQY